MAAKKIQFALDDRSVVVVIGSGAGGGTLANELAHSGIDVVCLEAGPRLSLGDIVNDEAEMFGKLSWLDPRVGSGQLHPHFPAWMCKSVGGTTIHWEGACPRLEPYEFKARSTYGEQADSSLIDWPVDYESIEPYYHRAEEKMGVTGRHGNPMLPENNNFKVMAAGAKAMGYKDIDTNHMAINSRARDGRPGCMQIGFCNSGCAIGAKWSTLYTEIPKAEETNHFELRPESMVTRITHDKKGRVNGVDYRDSDGVARHQSARAVCVAGNAIETPRILLNSHSSLFPKGLANKSDQVGRNYMTHFTILVISEMPGEVNFHRGAQQAGTVRDEHRNDPDRGFVGGYTFNTVPFGPENIVRFVKPQAWGREVSSLLDEYSKLAGMMMIGEDLPQATNRITLDPDVLDAHGQPVARVHYRNHPNTSKMKKHAWRQGSGIHKALGATNVFETGEALPATHNLGTARMSANPADGVCNQWGQSHDIANLYISDGSLFSTSGCANPTLTIVALAIRQAEHIVREISAKRL